MILKNTAKGQRFLGKAAFYPGKESGQNEILSSQKSSAQPVCFRREGRQKAKRLYRQFRDAGLQGHLLRGAICGGQPE